MRKTQDVLKNKILLRPNRQLLIEHNILSDTTASPVIQSTQCELKRARLVDNLNNKLSVRPGILDLVANNIFEIDANVNSIPKPKSCLTFHEYIGPLKKVEITKVPLHAASKPLEHNQTSSESHYRIQLRQQQLFLELIHNDKSIDNSNNLIVSLLKQSIDNIQSFETMNLADLKSECKKLNITSSGTKIKLIEKLKKMLGHKSQVEVIDKNEFKLLIIFFIYRFILVKTMLPSHPINNQSLSSPVQFLLPSSLSDQELHHHQQQEQNLVEVENQLETLKQYESSLLYSNQSSSTFQSIDNSDMILQQCNSILLPQIPNRMNDLLSITDELFVFQIEVPIEQQDKSKQNLQQHTSVPLTPEFVAQYLTQSQMSDYYSLSTYHSSSSLSTQSFTNQTTNNDVSFNLLDDYNEKKFLISILTVPHSYDDSNLNKVISTYFTRFLNQLDTDHCQHHHHHHLPFDSAFQQDALFFDTFSASNPMI
ncbi:unnamed protein product [Rotaria magnacalcarata]|uniref:SAP domain-containing protein n=1 Tax=Rotaria magnacalcarata TaxID=392030 RepID=A0A815G713_9BILA|nr:unnamed protein product [Rotaria magnacalcarata]CAF1563385.1 unnamed protein product [Rotaria magnacalcarata]